MKILIINVVCGVGSTGRICTDLATALETEGHEVKIAYGRGDVPCQYQKYAVKIGNNWDIKLHGLKARLFDGMGFGSRKATEKFIRWIKEYNPDVIHLHNLHGYYLNIEVLFNFLKTFDKKILWTLHDCWAFTGHSAYCDSISCERWKTGCYSCPLRHEYPKAFIDRSHQNWNVKKNLIVHLPKTMKLITPSKWLANLVQQSFMNKFYVQVIHNGIDTSVFFPRQSLFRKKYGLQDKFLILGVASVWNDMKGYTDFFELSRQLNDYYRIILVGVTQNQIKKLPPRIIGITRTSNIDEMAELYSAADVFLNLTYCDNYPTVNLEALCCGTPLITYKTGGSAEIANKYGETVVNRGDLEEIKREIYKKASCKENRISLNLRYLSKKYAIKSYEKIYYH